MAGRQLLFGAVTATVALAACSLDFDDFSYPDVIITSASSSSVGAGGSGGGPLFTSSSTAGGASNTSSGAGGSSAGGMSGSGGGCVGPNDCPPGTECQTATCSANMCGLDNNAQGDPCINGGNICDGDGNCYSCQAEPVAAMGNMTCPPECSSCNDTDNNFIFDECVIDCAATTCITVNCPAGFSCRVTCSVNSCTGVTINCPSSEDCTVACDDHQGNTAACAGTLINCDNASTCSLSCTNQGCNNTTSMVCGAGLCRGQCANNAMGTLNCNTSCWCDPGLCISQ